MKIQSTDKISHFTNWTDINWKKKRSQVVRKLFPPLGFVRGGKIGLNVLYAEQVIGFFPFFFFAGKQETYMFYG